MSLSRTQQILVVFIFMSCAAAVRGETSIETPHCGCEHHAHRSLLSTLGSDDEIFDHNKASLTSSDAVNCLFI